MKDLEPFLLIKEKSESVSVIAIVYPSPSIPSGSLFIIPLFPFIQSFVSPSPKFSTLVIFTYSSVPLSLPSSVVIPTSIFAYKGCISFPFPFSSSSFCVCSLPLPLPSPDPPFPYTAFPCHPFPCALAFPRTPVRGNF